MACAKARGPADRWCSQIGQQGNLSSLLEGFELIVTTKLIHDQLTISFISSTAQEATATIARAFESCLQSIVTALSRSDRVATLSDFPFVQWTYLELDSFVNTQLGQISRQWPTSIEAVHPCSTVQENCLLGQAIDPKAYLCSFSIKIRFSNEININKLTTAWAKLVVNTSILRTVFLETRHSKGQFVQVILKNSKPSVLSIHVSEDKVLELVDRSGLQPFDEFRVPHRLTTMQYSPTELLLKARY